MAYKLITYLILIHYDMRLVTLLYLWGKFVWPWVCTLAWGGVCWCFGAGMSKDSPWFIRVLLGAGWLAMCIFGFGWLAGVWK